MSTLGPAFKYKETLMNTLPLDEPHSLGKIKKLVKTLTFAINSDKISETSSKDFRKVCINLKVYFLNKSSYSHKSLYVNEFIEITD